MTKGSHVMAKTGIGRREFMKLAAAAGGASLTGFEPFSSLPEAEAVAVQDEWIPTVCHMCGGSTGVLAHVVAGRVVKIEPNAECASGVAPISTDYYRLKGTGARMCPKGNAGIMSLYDPDRVKVPLRRVGARGAGQWQEVSYDQAVTEIAMKLGEIKASSGPEKLVWFTEDASFNAIQQNFCNAYGTPNFLYHSNLCDVSRKVAFLNTLGHDRPLADLRNSKYILLFGVNPLGAMKWVNLTRTLLDGLDRGARLVVVDPRCSETAAKALAYGGQWLPIRPGTDGVLALALANVIIREGRYDANFVANWTVGFDRFAAFVADKTPEWAASITTIPPQTIRDVARELAGTKPAVVDVWVGTGMHNNGVEAGRAIAMLPGLLGQVDQPGTLVLPERRGPRFSVRPNPTGLRVDGARTKYPFSHSSGIYVEARDAMIGGHPYRPKAAVFIFQNFVLSVPNSARNLEALNKLELIVAVDTHMSETALMADYVIPGSTYLERYELVPLWVTFPMLSLRQPVVPPVFGQRVEYEFVADLARRMGYNDYPFNVPYERYLDDALFAGVGIHLEALKALPGATWTTGETRYRKYETAGFGTPSKKFEFYSQQMLDKGLNPLPEYVPLQDGPTHDYPFYLVNWKEALHTHSRTQNNRWLMELHGENQLWINVDRARALGIHDGDKVTVENQYGRATLQARVTHRIHSEVVGMTHGFGHWGLGPVARGKGANDSAFAPGRAEPISGQAAIKDGAVQVRRAS
jgi:thiosulfate reductase/polysulfide reductase chain A